jgi:hypothetical protein
MPFWGSPLTRQPSYSWSHDNLTHHTTLQCDTTHCNAIQHTTWAIFLSEIRLWLAIHLTHDLTTISHTTPHCNAIQHNTLQCDTTHNISNTPFWDSPLTRHPSYSWSHHNLKHHTTLQCDTTHNISNTRFWGSSLAHHPSNSWSHHYLTHNTTPHRNAIRHIAMRYNTQHKQHTT